MVQTFNNVPPWKQHFHHPEHFVLHYLFYSVRGTNIDKTLVVAFHSTKVTNVQKH